MEDRYTHDMECRQRTREYGRTAELRKQNQEGKNI
jgi:hypothetical protein